MMPADVAIRAAYKLKDQCYVRRDLKRLAATDLPTFYAVDTKGGLISHATVWKDMRIRMAHQLECRREERPVRILVQGRRARVEVALEDAFTFRSKRRGLVRREIQAHGWSDWVRTPSGWRQADLRFDADRWRDGAGPWHRA